MGPPGPEFIIDVARMALAVETAFGSPQDLEWSIAAGKLYALQARPITTTAPPGDEFDTRAVAGSTFTPAGVGEMLPGVLSPLVWTINGPLLEDAFATLAHRLGLSTPTDERWVARYRSRAALNLSLLKSTARRMPGGSEGEVERQYLGRRLAFELALPFPVLSDPSAQVATRLGALRHGDVVPSAFVLDDRAHLRWFFKGRRPADQPSLGRVMAELSTPGRLSVAAPSDVLTPVVAALVCVAAVLLAVLAAVADHQLLAWDVPIRDGLVAADSAWSSSALRRASGFGSRWVIAALSVPMMVLAWRRCRQLAVVIAAASLVALGLELLLKAAIDRPRPAGANGFGSSFPSGHALAAVAFWGLVPPWIYIVARRQWAWGVATVTACTVVALVGVSRVAVGAHWPSDVVGSYLGGAMFLLAAEWVLRLPWRRFDCPPCQLHAFQRTPAAPHRA